MKKLLRTSCLFVLTTVAIVSFIAPTVFGQEQKTAKVNPLPDKSVTDRVDKLFAQWDKPDLPGCALGIVKDGQLIYKRGYGMANLDHNVPITSKTVMDIMSQDKQFVGMSILLLAKRGKLSLDDEIQKYLPEIPRYQSPVTIRHLIHHTSGIREFGQLAVLGARAPRENGMLTEDEAIGWIMLQKESNFTPGDEHVYSNSGYSLLQQIVKKVSGKSFREFAEENIFKPLGMNNTHFQTDRTLVVKNRASGYYPRLGGGFSDAVSKRGAMNSTVEDLFLWDQNFYNNKLGFGSDLIGEQLSTGMLNNGEKLNYAFGLRVDEYKGLKRITHGGGGQGFESRMHRFPEQNFSVICLCNADNISSSGFANQVADVFLADQFKKVPEPVKETVAATDAPHIIIPEKELASLTGLYFEPMKGWLNRFYMKDGSLMIQPTFNTGPSYVLSPISRNRFKVVGAPPEIVFVPSLSGGPMQVKVISGGITSGILDAVQSVTPTTVQLAEFTGKYGSDELAGAIYTLSVNDGKLILEAMGRKDILLTPLFADAFSIVGLFQNPGEINRQLAIVRFVRNQQNAVSGFTLSRTPEGPRKLRFNKQ